MNIPFVKQFKPSLLIASLIDNPWTYLLGVAPFCLFVALVVVFSRTPSTSPTVWTAWPSA